MIKTPTPPGGAIPTDPAATRRAAHRAAVEATEALSTAPNPTGARLGVLPALWPGDPPSPMGLGSRRLCHDHPFGSNDSAELMFSATSNRAVIYVQHAPTTRTDKQRAQQEAALTRGIYNGYLSPATIRGIRRPVSTWLSAIFHYRRHFKPKWRKGAPYPVFLTLTLPAAQVHPDKFLHREALGRFVQTLQRTWGILHYFWRAEAQENGNLHYHLLVDRYIPKEELQIRWNRILKPLGYIAAFSAKHGHEDPPTTEVHRIREKLQDKKSGRWRKVDPVEYLLGYLLQTPTPEARPPGELSSVDDKPKLIGTFRRPDGTEETYVTRPVGGRLWGMSDALRGIREPHGPASKRTIYALYEGHRKGLIRRVDCDRATLFYGDIHEALRAYGGRSISTLQGYLLAVFATLYPGLLDPSLTDAHPPPSAYGLRVAWAEHRLTQSVPPVIVPQSFPTFEAMQDWCRRFRPDLLPIISAN